METFSTVAADFFKKLFFFLLFVFCIAYLYYKVQLMLRKGKKPGWVEQIGAPADIRRILSAVIEQKAHLKVRLNARKRSFLSTLLGVTPPTLLIDGTRDRGDKYHRY